MMGIIVARRLAVRMHKLSPLELKIMYRSTTIRFLILLGICVILTGCPLIRATGDAVEATGEGVGHAVEGTGDAIGRAGRELAP